MTSGYRTYAFMLAFAAISYLLIGIPIVLPMMAILGKKELEEEVERLKKEMDRKERMHSRSIADLSMKVENLEWQIKLAEPFIKKHLFRLESSASSLDLGVSGETEGEGGTFSREKEGPRWMDMVVYSVINADRSDRNTIFVFVPLTEGLKERNILLGDLEEMSGDTFLIKREEGNMIHFSEKCATRIDASRVSEKTFVLLLRVARFQEQRPIAIFEDNTHFISLLKDEAEKCPGRSAYDVLYPRHIVEWVKGCAEATLVDSKSFNNDPLAFFLIRRALRITAEGKPLDVLDMVVNNRFIQQRRHEALIEALSSYGHME